MAKKRITTNSTDYEQFSSVAPDLERKNARELVDELYHKNWPKEAIDNFESRNGVFPAQAPVEELEFDHRVLDLSYASDGKLFNKLMNGEGYKILQMEKTFTPDGTFKVFVIYSKPKVDKKEIENKDEE